MTLPESQHIGVSSTQSNHVGEWLAQLTPTGKESRRTAVERASGVTGPWDRIATNTAPVSRRALPPRGRAQHHFFLCNPEKV